MKTIKDIDREINDCLAFDPSDLIPEKRHRATSINRAQLLFLRVCKHYLETNPSEEFLRRELLKNKKALNKAETESTFIQWMKNNGHEYHTAPDGFIRAKRNEFKKVYEVSKLKKFQKTLNYLLS